MRFDQPIEKYNTNRTTFRQLFHVH